MHRRVPSAATHFDGFLWFLRNVWAKSGRIFSRRPVSARPQVVVRAEEGEAAKAAPKEAAKEAPAPWSPPTLNPDTPSPIFGGSTGGLLRKAQVRSSPSSRFDVFAV